MPPSLCTGFSNDVPYLCQDHVCRTETRSGMLRKIDNTSRPDKCSPCLGTCTPVAASGGNDVSLDAEAGSEKHGMCVSFYSQFGPPTSAGAENKQLNK